MSDFAKMLWEMYVSCVFLYSSMLLRSAGPLNRVKAEHVPRNTWKKASHCCWSCCVKSLGLPESGPAAAALTHTDRLEPATLLGRTGKSPPADAEDSRACIASVILSTTLCNSSDHLWGAHVRRNTLGASAADLAKIHRVPAWQRCRVRAGDPMKRSHGISPSALPCGYSMPAQGAKESTLRRGVFDCP